MTTYDNLGQPAGGKWVKVGTLTAEDFPEVEVKELAAEQISAGAKAVAEDGREIRYSRHSKSKYWPSTWKSEPEAP